jgi:TRAP-type C4-dicarboxylate transport system substrate-binding protein
MRLNTLIAGVIVGAGLAAAAGTTQAATKFTLGTSNTPKMMSVQAMQHWADAMRKRTNGELDMQIISGGALGGDKQLLQ